MGPFNILANDDMTDRQREVVAAIASGPRGGLKGPFLALIHNPELTSKVQELGEHLRFGTELPPELLEIAILVTARRWNCQYEWVAHARIARTAGLRDSVIEALQVGSRPDDMDAEESLVHDFAHQTAWHGSPDSGTLAAAIARYNRSTALDLLALCGYYTMLAFVLNAADLPLPDGVGPLKPIEAA